ncbi:MAG TPA: hypothetical protein VLW26_09140 [Steroidobacteraceae bacterium]|nr:hypothetical protein [Steroidobacteraceae bacterium]
MSVVNLLEAFARYQVKSSNRARSALTSDRALVLSCFYTRFHSAGAGVLKYEEDLAGDTGSIATLLRTHLSEALSKELDVKVIIAVPVAQTASLETIAVTAPRPTRMSFHARKDLVGRVTFFDGSRFVVEFRKASAAA